MKCFSRALFGAFSRLRAKMFHQLRGVYPECLLLLYGVPVGTAIYLADKARKNAVLHGNIL